MRNQVERWISSVKLDDSGMDKRLEKQTQALFFSEEDVATEIKIVVDETMKYQEMDGFGISITEASSHLCEKVLSKEKREAVLKDIFDAETGIGVSMIRQPIGASDHVTKPYHFAKEEQADDLPNFDFSFEEKEILPTVISAIKIAKREVKILVAPWSAPAWMKTNDSELGLNIKTCMPGFLKEDKYLAYATYITKFIQGYEQKGLKVYGVSPVNEPDFANYSWPTMPMTSNQASTFVADYLYPELEKHQLSPKIMCWDHNFDSFNYDDGEYVDQYFENEKAYAVTAGSAWHWYEGSPQTLARIKKKYPEKGIWLTEASGGEWGYKQWKEAFIYQAKSNIAITRNYCQSLIYWNMILDENSSPDYYYTKMQGVHSENRGLLRIEREKDSFNYNTDYYSLGHFSKFIEPGAHRILSTNHVSSGVSNVAFINPNGEKVLNIFNEKTTPQQVIVRWGNKSVTCILEALSLTTLKWTGEQVGKPLYHLAYNDCLKEATFSGEKNLNLNIMDPKGAEKGLRMIIDGSFFDDDNGAVTFKNMNGAAFTDIQDFEYFVFSAKNIKYYKGVPALVTLIDVDGKKCTIKTRDLAPYATWGDIYVPLEDVAGINLRQLKEIAIGFEGKDRDIFLIDDLRFELGDKTLAEVGK